MEHQVEFDLNAAIGNWRQRLEQSSPLRAGDLMELETHLRDAIAAFQNRGLSEEEAFGVAVRRIGGGPALASEYAKVHHKDVWLDRLFWMLAGVLCWTLVTLLSRAAADGTVIGGLAALGYKFGSTSGWAGMPGSWLVTLLQTAVQVLGTAALAAVGWLVLTNARLPAAFVRFLRGPLAFVLVAALCLILLVVQAFGYLKNFLLATLLSPRELGVISLSSGLASMVLAVFSTILLSVAFVWLARRRLRWTTET